MPNSNEYIAPISELIDTSFVPADLQEVQSLGQEGINVLLQRIR